MTAPSRATLARYWDILLPKPERRELKALARRQGIPVRLYAGLVLRQQIRYPRPIELVPLREAVDDVEE